MHRRIIATAVSAALAAGAVTAPQATAAEIAPQKDGVCAITYSDAETAAAKATLAKLTVGKYSRAFAAAIEAEFPEVKSIKVDPAVWQKDSYDEVEALLAPELARVKSEIPVEFALIYADNAAMSAEVAAEPLYDLDFFLPAETSAATSQSVQPVEPVSEALAETPPAADEKPTNFTPEELEAQRLAKRSDKVNEAFWASETGRLFAATLDAYEKARTATYAACTEGAATVAFPSTEVQPYTADQLGELGSVPVLREGVTWWPVAYEEPSETTREAKTSKQENTPASSRELSPGAIVGIVIAVALGLYLLSGVVQNVRMI